MFSERSGECQPHFLPNGRGYPLSLRLYGRCGAPYHGVFRRELSNRFYSCNNKKWESRATRCDDQAIRADDIEYVVWEQVCDLLAKPERLVALAEEYLGLRGKQIEVERDEVEATAAKVHELDRAIQNVLVNSAKAGLSASDIDAAVKQLTEEREALRRHVAMVEAWRSESGARPIGCAAFGSLQSRRTSVCRTCRYGSRSRCSNCSTCE
jgi:hypothetical protein